MSEGLDEPPTLACAGGLEMMPKRIAPPAGGMALGHVEALATQVPPAAIVEQPAAACAWVTSYLLDMQPQSLLAAALGRLRVKPALIGRLAIAVKESRHSRPCWRLACHAIVASNSILVLNAPACETQVWPSAHQRG